MDSFYLLCCSASYHGGFDSVPDLGTVELLFPLPPSGCHRSLMSAFQSSQIFHPVF